MKVIEQFIVTITGRYQILMRCENDRWYITDNGAFGQRDTKIEPVDIDEVNKILTRYKPPTQ